MQLSRHSFACMKPVQRMWLTGCHNQQSSTGHSHSRLKRAIEADTLIAQVGSLVPAESAELHVLDAVHTRMGASDNLAMGSSTFLEASPTFRLLPLRQLTSV